MFYENYCKHKNKIEKTDLPPKNLDLVSPLCPLSDSSCDFSHQPLMIYYYRDPEGTQPCHSVKVTRLVETLSGSGAALAYQGKALYEVNQQPPRAGLQPVLQWRMTGLVEIQFLHHLPTPRCLHNICNAGPTLGIHSPWNGGAVTKTHLAQTGICFALLVGGWSLSERENRRLILMSKLWSQGYPGWNSGPIQCK